MVVYKEGSIRKPGIEAEKALRTLYQWKKEKSGQEQTVDSFYPVDVEKLVNILGWKLEKRDIAGYSMSNEPLEAIVNFEQKTIFISTGGFQEGRINFSLAHEIGHILLHGEEGYIELNRAHSVREKLPRKLYQFDVEANRFAAEFLMPRKAVRFHFNKLLGCPEILMGSSLSQEIIKQSNKGKYYFEKLTRKKLAEIITSYKPSPEDLPLINIFNVTIEAMSRRLLELWLVMN